MNEVTSELRKKLGIDDWLKLVEEDKNLNGAYISFGQYMHILEKREKQLQNNWNELKKRINTRIKSYKDRQKLGEGYELTQVMEISLACDKKFLKEMQELEGNNE